MACQIWQVRYERKQREEHQRNHEAKLSLLEQKMLKYEAHHKQHVRKGWRRAAVHPTVEAAGDHAAGKCGAAPKLGKVQGRGSQARLERRHGDYDRWAAAWRPRSF